MKRILTLTAVAAMVFTACSKEESTGTGDKQVRITPTIANPALTPASMSSGTRATDTDFELNDKVGLTITMTADGSAFVANKEMSFDGTDFKTEGFLWYEDVNATSTLFAYYPYQAGAAAPAEFSVKADQSGANLLGPVWLRSFGFRFRRYIRYSPDLDHGYSLTSKPVCPPRLPTGVS